MKMTYLSVVSGVLAIQINAAQEDVEQGQARKTGTFTKVQW